MFEKMKVDGPWRGVLKAGSRPIDADRVIGVFCTVYFELKYLFCIRFEGSNPKWTVHGNETERPKSLKNVEPFETWVMYYGSLY